MKEEKLSVLVHKAKQRDEFAFQELYRRYHKLVHYIAYQIKLQKTMQMRMILRKKPFCRYKYQFKI